MQSQYKPSPLGYGSPRSSPFRRPESPASPSPLRQNTPSASPSRVERSNGRSVLSGEGLSSAVPAIQTTPGRMQMDEFQPTREPPAASRSPTHKSVVHGNALSQLQPSQVRTLREGFQILDRDSDGNVTRDDVAEMLKQLGLPSSTSDVSPFFPPAAQQTMSMASFLNTLSSSLAALSPSSELLSAFSAFDDDDSGQVDLAELRDALLHTAPEAGERALTEIEVDKIVNGFRGRRAFSKNMPSGFNKKGEVFKYQDFVHSVVGKEGGSGPASSEGSEDN